MLPRVERPRGELASRWRHQIPVGSLAYLAAGVLPSLPSGARMSTRRGPASRLGQHGEPLEGVPKRFQSLRVPIYETRLLLREIPEPSIAGHVRIDEVRWSYACGPQGSGRGLPIGYLKGLPQGRARCPEGTDRPPPLRREVDEGQEDREYVRPFRRKLPANVPGPPFGARYEVAFLQLAKSHRKDPLAHAGRVPEQLVESTGPPQGDVHENEEGPLPAENPEARLNGVGRKVEADPDTPSARRPAAQECPTFVRLLTQIARG